MVFTIIVLNKYVVLPINQARMSLSKFAKTISHRQIKKRISINMILTTSTTYASSFDSFLTEYDLLYSQALYKSGILFLILIIRNNQDI